MKQRSGLLWDQDRKHQMLYREATRGRHVSCHSHCEDTLSVKLGLGGGLLPCCFKDTFILCVINPRLVIHAHIL